MRCLNEALEGSCRGIFKPWHQRLDASAGSVLRSEDDDPELLLHIPFSGAIKLTAITIIGGANGTSPSKLKACRVVACLLHAAGSNRQPLLRSSSRSSMACRTAGRRRFPPLGAAPWLSHPLCAYRVHPPAPHSCHAQAYINRDDLDFGAVADLPPVQEWELVENLQGQMEYPTQCVREQALRRAEDVWAHHAVLCRAAVHAVLAALAGGATSAQSPASRRHLRRVAKFQGVHSLDLHIPSNFGASCTEVVFVGLRGEFSERRRQVG